MAELVTVTGRFENPDETPVAGWLEWSLVPNHIPDTTNDVDVYRGPVRAELDETGSFTVVLRATDDPDLVEHVEGSIIYRVRHSTGAEWQLLVPSPGPHDWADLAPPAESAGVVIPVPGPPGADSTVPGPPGPAGADSTVPGPQGATGPAGPQGATGAAGASTGAFPLEWKTSTAATDPAHGFIKANNATATAYTQIYTSVYDKNGQALVVLNELEAGDGIFLYEAGQLSTWNRYELTGAPTLHGYPVEWATLPVVYAETGPAPFTPAGNTQILLTTPLRGEPGPTGPAGAQGIQGIPGSDSTVPGPAGEKGDPGEPGGSLLTAFWTYATNTSAPPTSGQIRTNSPITTLWISETDTDGMARAAGLATAEDGDTIIVRAANGTAMDLLITGAPVDSGTYWSIPVSVTTGTVTKGARTQIGILSPTPHGLPAGGTDGQVLTKTGSSDYAADWETVAAGGIDAEAAVDAVATALTAGNNIDITYNDAAGTITVDVEALTKSDVGLSNVDNTADANKPTSTVTQGQINDLHDELDAKAPIRRTLNAQTGTTYTPVVADENLMVTLSNAAAITVSLPQNSAAAFPVGAEVDFLWLGVGQPTFQAGSGATVNGTPGLKLRAQYSAATAKKVSTNGWVVIGDLAA